MNTQKFLQLIILMASLTLLAIGIGPQLSIVAQAAGATNPAIPYAGQLAAVDGQPVADGSYDFRFEIYDVAVGGQALWAETHRGLAVRAGGFAAPLGSIEALPMTLDGRELWLAISVRGPGEARTRR